jgi:glycolate oxidase FAD binding subunit
VLAPCNPTELADALRGAASLGRTISIAGNSTKRRMAGPIEPADVTITTMSLRGVLQYEPRDLTVSVLAGLGWSDFTALLAHNRQMVPLDPAFDSGATVGGVIASNVSGPRRRLYGTARDLVIGMTFITLEGKLVKTGGMVVKNVAGLDMAKLMIGSFGTLAAIAVVNFKVQPMPEVERSFLLPFDSLSAAMTTRNTILRGPLQPAAIDLFNPAAARTMGHSRWVLGLRVGGNEAAVRRYEQELAQFNDAQAKTTRPCGDTWRISRRNIWPRTRMARWCGCRVR